MTFLDPLLHFLYCLNQVFTKLFLPDISILIGLDQIWLDDGRLISWLKSKLLRSSWPASKTFAYRRVWHLRVLASKSSWADPWRIRLDSLLPTEQHCSAGFAPWALLGSLAGRQVRPDLGRCGFFRIENAEMPEIELEIFDPMNLVEDSDTIIEPAVRFGPIRWDSSSEFRSSDPLPVLPVLPVDPKAVDWRVDKGSVLTGRRGGGGGGEILSNKGVSTTPVFPGLLVSFPETASETSFSALFERHFWRTDFPRDVVSVGLLPRSSRSLSAVVLFV